MTRENKTILVTVIVFVVLLGAATTVFLKKTPSATKESVVYCSPDGTLTATQSIQSHRSYCIKPGPTGGGYAANAPKAYTFSIVDDQGNTLKDFEITHTKLLHLIIVRKDLAYFQHVHPEFDQTTGQFRLFDLTFPADGEYRIFADFAAVGGQKDSSGMPLMATPSEDVLVGNTANYSPQPIGSQERSKTFEGYQVTLSTSKALESGAESMLTFDLKQNGKAVTDLQPYLGALGHSVILREGNLDFIHAHPMEDVSAKQNGKVDFMVDFPEAGIYKVFTQFQRGGKVFTTDFVVSVAQGTGTGAAPAMDMSMPGMTH